MSIRDADVIALNLARRVSTFAEASSSLGLDIDVPVQAAIEVAIKEADDVRDLVGALVGHVIALAALLEPRNPDKALDQLEELTTLQRLDPREGDGS